jgi:hypothetical protein
MMNALIVRVAEIKHNIVRTSQECHSERSVDSQSRSRAKGRASAHLSSRLLACLLACERMPPCWPQPERHQRPRTLACAFPSTPWSGRPFWTSESWIARLRGHSEGPEALSARCATVVVEVIAEVPRATPTMQAVQDSCMRLVTPRTVGV